MLGILTRIRWWRIFNNSNDVSASGNGVSLFVELGAYIAEVVTTLPFQGSAAIFSFPAEFDAFVPGQASVRQLLVSAAAKIQ